MDYTKVPRELIYKDRQSIDEFDINIPDSLDACMLEKIENSEIIEFEGAADYILQIFNNAHYITTLILMEPHPLQYLKKYMIIAEHTGCALKDITQATAYKRYFESFIMAMVNNYLTKLRPDLYNRIDENNLLAKIWNYHNKNFDDKQWDGKARFLYFNNTMYSLLDNYTLQHKFEPLHTPEELLTMQENNFQTEDKSGQDNQLLVNLNNRLKEENDELRKQLENNKNSNEPKWIDWLDDDVFKPGINAEMIYKSLVNISAAHLSDRPKCYVLFRVLDVIKALKKNAAQKDILKWWNAHFGCDWHDDNQFKFTELPESIRNEVNILKWNKCQGRNSEHYYSYAQELLKEFAWNKGQGEYEIKKSYLK